MQERSLLGISVCRTKLAVAVYWNANVMKLKPNPFKSHKHSHVFFFKLAALFLLIAFAFLLLFSDSTPTPTVLPSSILDKQPQAETPITLAVAEINTQHSDYPLPQSQDEAQPLAFAPLPYSDPHSLANHSQTSEHAKCDIFYGEWIEDPSGPSYTNESCHVIEDHQNCMMNGRPDSGYLYWRWRPRDCELAKFDPERFLDLMRDKTWAFIGDSISRNHVQSLLCILSQVEPAIEVYHDEEYKSRRWHFPAHNFTLSVIWTPYLIKAAIFEDINGVSTSETQLHLDQLDQKWTQVYKDIDYAVIGGGKWFLKTAIYHENDTVIGCHYCPGKNLTELGYEYAYRKTLQLMFNFLLSSEHRAVVFLRTSTPDHFENGEWFSGGTCNRTQPFREGEIDLRDIDAIMRDIELEEYGKAAAAALRVGVDLKLLDTTRLSMLRPDGHPGPYRQFHPFADKKDAIVQKDCLHWCLPGPIDSWSYLLMELLLNVSGQHKT